MVIPSHAFPCTIGTFRTTTTGTCLGVDDAYTHLTGCSVDQATNQPWQQAIHPADRDWVTAAWQQAIQANQPLQVKCRVQWGPTTTTQVWVQLTAEQTAAGHVGGYVGTISAADDIQPLPLNARHQSHHEQQLREMRDQLMASQQAEQVNRRLAEREALLRDISQQINQQLLRKIGQRDGQFLDLPTLFAQACEGIRQFMAADRVGIFRFDLESGFDDGVFVAESVAAPFDSVLAVPFHDHTFGDRFADLYFKGRYFACDDIYDDELSHCHIDILSQFQVRANLVIPLTLNDGLWGLLCIHQCSDKRHWLENEIELTQQLANQVAIAIQQAHLFEQLEIELTERQLAEQQLTERNQQLSITNLELARATRLKNEFLANMSHELRTPLNAILANTECLQDEIFGEISSQQGQALHTIEETGTHLLELINDILDLAKIESGKLELDCAPVQIGPLCQSSLTYVQQLAQNKRIQLNANISTTLPTINLDERRILQVLLNLLNNAVKFTPEGGQVTLTVSCEEQAAAAPNRPQAYLNITVQDTGIGIAPEHIDSLFQPFVQVDSALNRQYMGTGLGLALVKRIVELHDGTVELTSEVGVGSCFTIVLPWVAVTASDAAPCCPISLANPQPTAAMAPLILLAEDNKQNSDVLTTYLKAKGYRVCLVTDGAAAIAQIQSERPDLVLMDIQMPRMDGLEAIRRIRRDPEISEIQIVALTALAMKGDRERCLNAGADDYIGKPVKLKQLLHIIQQLLASATSSAGLMPLPSPLSTACIV